MSEERHVQLQEWESRMQLKVNKHGQIHAEFAKIEKPHPDAVEHISNLETTRKAAEEHLEKAKKAHAKGEHTIWDTMAEQMEQVMNEFKGAVDSATAYF